MTNKEFFLHVVGAEQPVFAKVLGALPQDKLDYKPDGKGRTAGSLAYQLASQAGFIAAVAGEGKPDFGAYHEPKNPTIEEMLALLEKNFTELKKRLKALPEAAWENDEAVLAFPGGEWKAKKYDMAWSFLFDGIHHRGQLTTYLRAMGAKVPSVYGGSADERPSA